MTFGTPSVPLPESSLLNSPGRVVRTSTPAPWSAKPVNDREPIESFPVPLSPRLTATDNAALASIPTPISLESRGVVSKSPVRMSVPEPISALFCIANGLLSARASVPVPVSDLFKILNVSTTIPSSTPEPVSEDSFGIISTSSPPAVLNAGSGETYLLTATQSISVFAFTVFAK